MVRLGFVRELGFLGDTAGITLLLIPFVPSPELKQNAGSVGVSEIVADIIIIRFSYLTYCKDSS